MEYAVVGATGRTGRPLINQALDRGHEVVAFVRDQAKLPSTVRTADGVRVVEDDADSGEEEDRVIAGDNSPVDAVEKVLA